MDDGNPVYAADPAGTSVLSSVDVNGTLFAGYERLSSAGTTASTSLTCLQGSATWTCYTGTASITCPAGKVALGGGCDCSNVQDSMCYDYPTGTTGWTCRKASKTPSTSFTVFVFCGRLAN